MVYCGKPSKGCSNCRERKIRCDQREPGCGQCEKRSQSCPGYRNLVDLMFRDESSHVIKKAKARQRRKGMLSPDSSSPEMDDTATNGSTTPGSPRVPGQGTLSLFTPSSTGRAPAPSKLQTKLTWKHDDNLLPSPDDGSWPSTPRIALMYNLAPTFQERGWAFFFSKYVTVDENACHHKFDYIYDVWKPTSLVPDKQLDGVMASMTAVGLVGVATLMQSKDVMDAARKSYGTALCLINAALKDPDEATKDTTMLCILILGLFELMTDPSAKTMMAWHEHIHGAAALAKMRGVNQFRTAAGVKMFSTLCQTVIISCVQRQEPMPPLLLHLNDELVKLGVNPGFEANRPIFRILQMRHDMKKGKLNDSDQIIQQLADIDREFERVLANWPEYMRYKAYRVTTPRTSVYGDQLHRYPNSLNYITWNGVRTCRILVLESVMGEIQSRFGTSADAHFTDVPQHYINEFCLAKGKLERMVSAIAASTPQHFGLVKPLNNSGEMITEITSIEIREPLNLQLAAQSPASATTISSSSPAFSSPRSLDSAPLRDNSPAALAMLDDGGPTVVDIMRARTLDEEAERYMLLASATDPMVWPLFVAGMASVCTPPLKEFVVGRLMAVYEQRGLTQARRIAQVVRNREVVTSRWTQLPLRPRFEGQRHSLAV